MLLPGSCLLFCDNRLWSLLSGHGRARGSAPRQSPAFRQQPSFAGVSSAKTRRLGLSSRLGRDPWSCARRGSAGSNLC
jgi:hypothetical protein